MQSIDDLAHHALSFGQSVMVADCYTDSRCYLCYHAYIRICQCFPYFIHIGSDRNGSGRAEYSTLTTVYTVRRGNLPVKCRHNHSFGTTECKSQCTDTLQFFTGADTVSAKDTFIRISHQRRGTQIQFSLFSCILETDIFNTQTMCQFLQNTFSTLYTGGTVTAVCCQKQFHDEFSVFSDTSGIGMDHHAVSRLFRTGCKHLSSVIFHGTQATGTKCGKLGVVTQCRDIDTRLSDH